MPSTTTHCAIDIGGTKTAYAVIEEAEPHAFRIRQTWQHPTGKGIPAFHSLLADIQTTLAIYLKDHNLILQTIGIGFPRKLIGPTHSVIAPGVSENISAHPGEWNHVDLLPILETVFPPPLKIRLQNDAIAQMKGGAYLLNDQLQALNAKKIAYIGPGTGLGGGFAERHPDGALTPYTDGHIYDIIIPDPQGHPQGAEELFSGRAFATLTGHSAKEANADPALFQKLEPQIRQLGHHLADLVTTIHTGQIRKSHTAGQWPPNDCQAVRQTDTVLLGGSIGTRGQVAQTILETATQHLTQKGIRIHFLQIPEPETAALIGTLL